MSFFGQVECFACSSLHVSMSTYRVVGVVTPRQGCFYVSHISHINGAHWAVTQQLYLDVLYKLSDWQHFPQKHSDSAEISIWSSHSRSTQTWASLKLGIDRHQKMTHLNSISESILKSQKVFGPANIQLLPIIQPVGGSIAAYKSQIRQVQRSVEVLAGLAWTNIGEDGLAGYVLTHC